MHLFRYIRYRSSNKSINHDFSNSDYKPPRIGIRSSISDQQFGRWQHSHDGPSQSPCVISHIPAKPLDQTRRYRLSQRWFIFNQIGIPFFFNSNPFKPINVKLNDRLIRCLTAFVRFALATFYQKDFRRFSISFFYKKYARCLISKHFYYLLYYYSSDRHTALDMYILVNASLLKQYIKWKNMSEISQRQYLYNKYAFLYQ